METQPVDQESSKGKSNRRKSSYVDITAQYIREICKTPLLSMEEERRLGIEIKNGSQEARDHLITANLRLVVFIAKQYYRRYKPSQLSILDLFQEGNFGLMRAVETFDYRKGFRFSTYATDWIKQSVARAILNKDRTIRVPVYMFGRIVELNHATSDLLNKLGRAPNAYELATHMGKTDKEITTILAAARISMSLDTPIGIEEAPLSETVEDSKSLAAEDVIDLKSLRHLIGGFFDKLSEREKRILELRFGFADGEARLLKEIGYELKLSKQRVEQIEFRAFEKLRELKIEEVLKDYR